MKLETDRMTVKDATTALQRLLGPGRVTLPALSGVMLETGDGTLTLTATDLDTTVRATIVADVVETGAALVPRRALADAVKNGPDRLVIAIDDGADRVTIGAASLRTLIAEDWPRPALPDRIGADGTTLTAGDLVTLGQVARSASTDQGRPILTGVRFAGDEVAATDSYRLAVAPMATGMDTLVPARFVSAVAKWKLDEQTAVRVGLIAGNGRAGRDVLAVHGTIAAGPKRARRRVTVMAAASTIEGTYPNYSALWPTEHDARWTFDAAPMVDALGQLAPVLGAGNVPVVVEQVHGGFRLSATCQETGSADVTIPGEVDGIDVGPVALQPGFLRTVLEQTGGTVTAAVRGEVKPVVFEGTGSRVRVLQMPMRVS